MKDTQDLDGFVFYQVRDAIVPIDKDADFAVRLVSIPVSDLLEGLQNLHLVINAGDHLLRCFCIVIGDVIEDVL